MKLFFFDTETTGTDPNYDRIIQFGGILGDFNLGNKRFTEIERINQFINVPIRIPQGASDVHHIYNKDLIGYDYIDSYINKFLSLIKDADFVIGHNVEFDKKMVIGECRRLGINFDDSKIKWIDTMKPTTNLVGSIGKNGRPKRPKLIELYRFLFGRDFDGAHDAFSDITATKDCFIELVNNYGYFREIYNYDDSKKSEYNSITDSKIEKHGYNNKIYIGERSNGKPNGLGTMYDSNGNKIYTGEFKNGTLDGIVKVYSKGYLLYIGEFRNGKANGFCKLFHENGNTEFIGWTIDFKFNGNGTSFYENGTTRYDGEYFDGECNGYGTAYYINGNIDYKGYRKNGLGHGFGEKYREDGSLMFSGERMDGEMQNGKFYRDDGSLLYDGERKDGEYFKGTQYYKNGKKQYEGGWSNGNPNGRGIMYYKNGKIKQDGYRVKGIFVLDKDDPFAPDDLENNQ